MTKGGVMGGRAGKMTARAESQGRLPGAPAWQLGAVVLLAVVTATGCASPASDWAAAGATNSIAAYETFVKKHPESEFTAEAQQRLQGLRWQRAQTLGTIDGYREILELYRTSPSMAHAAQANIDMADHFTAELLKVSNDNRPHCLKSGAGIDLRVRLARPTGAAAILSPMTTQGESVTGEWIEPRAFSISESVHVGFSDNVLVTSCMMDGGDVSFFKFDVIRPNARPVPAEPPSVLSLKFQAGGSMRIRLLFEIGADRLTSVRAFGRLVRLRAV